MHDDDMMKRYYSVIRDYTGRTNGENKKEKNKNMMLVFEHGCVLGTNTIFIPVEYGVCVDMVFEI